MAWSPISAAIMRAEPPLGLRRSTLAPRFSSSFAMRSCPQAVARCSIPRPLSSSASTCPPFCSHPSTGCSSPRLAAPETSGGSGAGTHNVVPLRAAGARSGAADTTEGGAAETPPTSCKLAGLSSTASASPSTATSYRPLATSKRPTTPHRPLSSGRDWRPPMRTRQPEKLGVGAAVVAGGAAACCRSSLAMAAWPSA
eukprot:scaffold74268_cov74-Phaeocystis_antarctica.AAC.4